MEWDGEKFFGTWCLAVETVHLGRALAHAVGDSAMADVNLCRATLHQPNLCNTSERLSRLLLASRSRANFMPARRLRHRLCTPGSSRSGRGQDL